MAEISVPMDLLASKLNIGAIREISGKVENKEVTPFDPSKVVTESVQPRIPKNLTSTSMPEAFYSNMIPSEEETDKLWTASDSQEDHSNGLASSILSESEERDIPDNKFKAMKLINERLDPSTNNTQQANKPYPSSTPVNIPKSNSGPQQPIGTFGSLSEERVREIIKEEVLSAMEKIVKKEEEGRLNEETIQIRIGKTVFSGNLKPIVKRKKK
jgi:hypothetical protein